MVACGHCGGCCAHCGAICGGCSGAPASGIAGAFGAMGYGGYGFRPIVGGFPFFHHRHDDDDESTLQPLDCDALSDPDHPGHRDAVKAIAHVDDATHASILQRIKDELAKL